MVCNIVSKLDFLALIRSRYYKSFVFETRLCLVWRSRWYCTCTCWKSGKDSERMLKRSRKGYFLWKPLWEVFVSLLLFAQAWKILRDVLHRLIELLFISKVSIKNQERDAAIKRKINDESSSDSDRTLTPTAIPTANSPIILTPNKGNTRFKKKMCF